MRGLKNISVRAKLMTLTASFVAGTVIFGLLAYITINAVKIDGSPVQHRIADLKKLRADFLPPDASLLPANFFLYRTLLSTDPAAIETNQQKVLDRLSVFEKRRQFWMDETTDPSMRALLTKAYEPAERYLDAVRTRMLPLMAAGKMDEANSLRRDLTARLFDLHEAALTDIDALSAQQLVEAELDANNESSRRIILLCVVLLASLTISGAIAWIIADGIVRPLKVTVEMLREVSQGNLTRRMEVASTDEIGQMGTALNEMIETLSQAMTEIAEDAEVLSNASKDLSTVSHKLSANSQHTTSQAAAVSSAAEQVSQNAQTVSTATEEMSASIKDISKNASEAAEVASSASRLAGATTATMTKLSESSAEIGNVIKVITSIAEQTNLLALNATIEAARAGEAGKGFAVVANEVKELAKETAKATEDIGARVQAIQADAKGAVHAIDQISTVIGRINDIQNTIASAVEEQTVTTNAISHNISETAKGSSDIATNITGVATAATETQNSATASQLASEELSKLAARLGGIVGHFKLADNGYGGPSRHDNG